MPLDTFELTYDGAAIRNGTMDVYELGPALVAVGNLVRDANRFLNGDQATIDVRVGAEFRAGSFGIHFLLEQQVVESANIALAFASVLDPTALIHAIFGVARDHPDKIVEGVVLGLLGIYKLLKGEKPKPGSITIKDNHGTINVGDRNITVDARGAQLYANDVIRTDVDHVVQSITNEGIDRILVKKEDKILDELSKVDVPRRVLALGSPQSSTENVLIDTREAFVKIVTANFEEGKWRFSDGGAKFSARIGDPIFQQKLDNREEGFYKGDVLRVVLKTEQKEKANGKIHSEYVIEEVLEHRRPSEQQKLLPTTSRKKK